MLPMAGCDGVLDCAQLCSNYSDCVEDIDVTACTEQCQDQVDASAATEAAADNCEACNDNAEGCTETQACFVGADCQAALVPVQD